MSGNSVRPKSLDTRLSEFEAEESLLAIRVRLGKPVFATEMEPDQGPINRLVDQLTPEQRVAVADLLYYERALATDELLAIFVRELEVAKALAEIVNGPLGTPEQRTELERRVLDIERGVAEDGSDVSDGGEDSEEKA